MLVKAAFTSEDVSILAPKHFRPSEFQVTLDVVDPHRWKRGGGWGREKRMQ